MFKSYCSKCAWYAHKRYATREEAVDHGLYHEDISGHPVRSG